MIANKRITTDIELYKKVYNSDKLYLGIDFNSIKEQIAMRMKGLLFDNIDDYGSVITFRRKDALVRVDNLGNVEIIAETKSSFIKLLCEVVPSIDLVFRANIPNFRLVDESGCYAARPLRKRTNTPYTAPYMRRSRDSYLKRRRTRLDQKMQEKLKEKFS